MQGYGKHLWLMHGMFRANGGCGYVKKPEFLLKSSPDNHVFDPKVKLPVKKTMKVSKHIKPTSPPFNFLKTSKHFLMIITGENIYR